MPDAPAVRRYLLVYVLAAMVVVASGLGVLYYVTVHSAHRAPVVTLATNLTVSPTSPVGPLPPGYFGINLRVEYPPAIAPGSALSGTPISLVRWPGGQVAERLDALHGLLYSDPGTSTVAASNLTEFTSWCRGIGCHAILQLPAEIDNASFAAQEVKFVVHGLGFEPSYWEIGNEPAGWTHSGIPWSSWNATQNVTVDAGQYAQIVRAYIRAILPVDPRAQFLGLGGLGIGALGEANWLKELALVDGANLSAYSIHVYPAGGAVNGTPSLAGFFATLNGSASIPQRLPADRAALVAGCKRCASAPLLIDELGSGTNGGPYGPEMAGFPEVPYIAAELLEGIEQNASSAEVFAYESSYPGSFVDPVTGAARPIAALYSQFLPHLPARGEATSVTVAVPGLYVFAGGNAGGSNQTLFVVNTNPDAVSLTWTLPTAVLPGGPTITVEWSPSDAAPVAATGSVPTVLEVTVPSEGLYLWHAGGGP